MPRNKWGDVIGVAALLFAIFAAAGAMQGGVMGWTATVVCAVGALVLVGLAWDAWTRGGDGR